MPTTARLGADQAVASEPGERVTDDRAVRGELVLERALGRQSITWSELAGGDPRFEGVADVTVARQVCGALHGVMLFRVVVRTTEGTMNPRSERDTRGQARGLLSARREGRGGGRRVAMDHAAGRVVSTFSFSTNNGPRWSL